MLLPELLPIYWEARNSNDTLLWLLRKAKMSPTIFEKMCLKTCPRKSGRLFQFQMRNNISTNYFLWFPVALICMVLSPLQVLINSGNWRKMCLQISIARFAANQPGNCENNMKTRFRQSVPALSWRRRLPREDSRKQHSLSWLVKNIQMQVWIFLFRYLKKAKRPIQARCWTLVMWCPSYNSRKSWGGRLILGVRGGEC